MATKEVKSRYEELTETDEETVQVPYVPRATFKKQEKIDFSSLGSFNLRLVQKMSKAVDAGKAQPGQFWLENFPALESVTIIPFAGTKIRRYQPDPNSMMPKCSSPDGEQGYGDPGILCADCRLKEWGPRDPKTGKSTKPPCKEGVAIRGFSLDHGVVVDMEFMGQSQRKGAFIQVQGAAKGYTNFAVQISSERVSSGNYTWYEPIIEIVPVPEERETEILGWFDAVQAQMEEATPAIESS